LEPLHLKPQIRLEAHQQGCLKSEMFLEPQLALILLVERRKCTSIHFIIFLPSPHVVILLAYSFSNGQQPWPFAGQINQQSIQQPPQQPFNFFLPNPNPNPLPPQPFQFTPLPSVPTYNSQGWQTN